MAKKSRTIRVDPEVKAIIDKRRELMRANGLKASRSDALASLLRGDDYADASVSVWPQRGDVVLPETTTEVTQ